VKGFFHENVSPLDRYLQGRTLAHIFVDDGECIFNSLRRLFQVVIGFAWIFAARFFISLAICEMGAPTVFS
jgi:hypothetical protein